MRADIKIGGQFPDYELPDHTNVKRKLSLLQGIDPMILMLGRGIYCPKDRQQLHQLVQFSSQCDVGFTRLVTINCDNFVLLNDLRLGVGAHWPFLFDEEKVILNDLEIAEYTDTHNNPMIPHTFRFGCPEMSNNFNSTINLRPFHTVIRTNNLTVPF